MIQTGVSGPRKQCNWLSLDSVVPNHIQSCVQVLLDICNLPEYTGVRGRYILRSEDHSGLPVWRQLPEGGRQKVSLRGSEDTARSQETEGLSSRSQVISY